MTSPHSRWEKLQILFDQAVQYEAEDRDAFLASIRAEDPRLCEEVKAMIAADLASTSMLDEGLDEVIDELFKNARTSEVNHEFGPYRLTKLLGEGGMGTVWLAERQDPHTFVAIKLLPHASLSPSRRGRFAQEIRTLCKLRHPCIARFLDAGITSDSTPWFVMDYVDGVRLDEYVVQARLGVLARLRLFRKICETVLYAHSLAIIHRDLKPSNILIEWDGTPKLLDFGIARDLREIEGDSEHTRNGLRLLSLHYAAPEWIRDGTIGLFTDVYSLGVILYELLTGSLPLRNIDNRMEIIEAPIPRPSIQAKKSFSDEDVSWSDLDLLCLKTLQFEPGQRYQSVEALLRDLDHCLNDEPLEAQPATFSYRLRKFIKRNRREVTLSAVVSLSFLCLFMFFSLRLARSHKVERAEAERSRSVELFLEDMFRGADPAAGPAKDLKVVSLLKGAREKVDHLKGDPALQADLYRTLGNVYEQLGDYDQSIQLIDKAIALDRGLTQDSSLALADDLKAKSVVLVDLGKTMEGEKSARDALAFVKAHRPLDESRLADMTSALGTALVEGGKYKEGAEIISEAVRMEETQHPGSQLLSDSISELANAEGSLGNYRASEQLNERGLSLDEARYGDHHPTVATDMLNLAQLADSAGDYRKAEQYKRHALEITEAWYGPDHPETADQMDLLASTLVFEGKYQDAKNLARGALPILIHAYGDSHPRIALNLNVQGRADSQMGNLKAAEQEDLRAFEIYKSALGIDYKTAIALSNLANVLFREDQYGRAEDEQRHALSIMMETLPAGDYNIGIAQLRLGRIIFCEGRTRQALPYTQNGAQIVTQTLSPDTDYVATAKNDLAMITAALKQNNPPGRSSPGICPKPN